MSVRFFVSPKTCEHCDDHHTEQGWWGWSDDRQSCGLSAKSGSGAWAPYGWCCRGCEPAMRAVRKA